MPAWLHIWRRLSISRVRCEDTDDTRSHPRPIAHLWLGTSRNWSFFQSVGHNTGRHQKAPVCCLCSRLVALHGAPQTLEVMLVLMVVVLVEFAVGVVVLVLVVVVALTLMAHAAVVCTKFKHIPIDRSNW